MAALHLCSDEQDALKVKFTLAALEAKSPFANQVHAEIRFSFMLLCVGPGADLQRQGCGPGVASAEIGSRNYCGTRKGCVRN